MTKLKNIIYISGSGRSGSTLIERILHSSPGACSLGELHCLWRLPAAEIACSCGERLPDDPFWRRILADAAIDEAAIAELRALEEAVCRTGFIARHGFSLEALRADRSVQRFLELQFRLFEAISAVSGCETLVDSSKAGPRAWLLACDPRVRIVHLYRDPTDVLVSWRSSKFDPGLGTAMKRMSIRAAAMDWWKVEDLARRLSRDAPVAWMNYHRFCAEPQASLEATLAELDLAVPPAPRWTRPDTVEQGENYHSLNGNPDRFDKTAIKVSLRQPAWNAIAAQERPIIRLAGSALRGFYPLKWDTVIRPTQRLR